MTKKAKGRTDWHRATLKTAYTHNFNRIRSNVKGAIIRAALAGLLSVPVADWIIRHGGLRDA